jgi:hypothetical protein
MKKNSYAFETERLGVPSVDYVVIQTSLIQDDKRTVQSAATSQAGGEAASARILLPLQKLEQAFIWSRIYPPRLIYGTLISLFMLNSLH